MSRNVITLLFIFFLIFISAGPTPAMTGKDVVRLKRAGVSDETIQFIIKTKAIETAAFSIDDIVNMKKAGVSEETLRLLIEEAAFPANSDPVVYGRTTRSIDLISPRDIIDLKKNGISDDVIQSLIEAAKSCNEKDLERAWRMLENTDLRIYTPGRR